MSASQAACAAMALACAFLAYLVLRLVVALDERDRTVYSLRHANDELRRAALSSHGWKLGQRCSVWSRGKWHPGCTCVAVSHKGAVCVRDGSRTWWVGKDRADRSVKFEEEQGQ